MKQLVIFLSCMVMSMASASVLPCFGNQPFPKAVVIENCDGTEDRCGFIRGKNFKADIQFTALSQLKAMIPQVNVTVGGVRVEADLPLDRYDACSWLLDGAQPCPVPKGRDTTWRLNIPMDLTTPLVPVKLEVSLVGDDGKTQFCFVLLGKVVAF